jgi:nucleoporin NUP82
VPSWLNEPAPGHKLFVSSPEDARPPSQLYSSKPKPGPRRAIAHRGTEIFVAVGKQIRWGSLVNLKESWESKQSKSVFGSARHRKAESDGSFEVYDEEGENGSVQNGAASEGYRVRTLCYCYDPASWACSDMIVHR